MTRIARERGPGWTPFVWLVYLVPFVIYPFTAGEDLARRAVTLVAVVVFLLLYFRGFRAEPRELALITGATTLLAVAFAPINPGTPALFIFAAAFAGGFPRPRQGVMAIVAVVATIAVEAWVLSLAVWSWVPAIVFSICIGAVNIHYSERERGNLRLRLANEQIEHLAKVAERERIGRDLHDLLGHTLSVIVLKSELAHRISRTDAERAAKEIAEVEQVARQALQEVRAAVQGYRSAGFGAEIRRAAEVLRDAGIATEVSVDPAAGTIPPDVETVLTLAVREGVTNILRHARASCAAITVRREHRSLRLSISDDGTGSIRDGGGGIAGMRERLAAVGGTLEIRESPGTTLLIQVPGGAGGLS